MDRQMSDRQQKDRKTDRQTYRQMTDRQKDRQMTDRLKYRQMTDSKHRAIATFGRTHVANKWE